MRKWLAGAALVAAAAVVYVATRDADGKNEPKSTPSAAPDRVQPTSPRARAAPPPATKPGATYHVPWNLSDPSPGVKKWKQEGLPGTFREVVAPDDSPNVEEQMTYKKRRLRFRLTDAAAACYDGPDSKQEISMAYTLVVDKELLRVEDVRVLTSSIEDHALQECIVSAVRSLATTAPGMPDARSPQSTSIQLHDLYVRNRSSGD